MSGIHPGQPEVNEPRRYAIRVKGHLEQRWAEWFADLSITQASDGTTLLAGALTDQAALHGVLNKIRDLGLPIISVQGLSPEA
ncbi:MAG: hypothetical protein ABI847_17130 [Anaerolineales bacterium]